MPIARRVCWRWPDCASDIRENPGRDFVGGWLTCGSALSSRPKPTGRCPTTNEGEAELLAAVARIIRVFGELGVDYLVGESIATGRISVTGLRVNNAHRRALISKKLHRLNQICC